MRHYARAHQIASQFDPTIFASARNFFLECFRSSYLVSIIIKKYQPSCIYVSDVINESLYRKYHSETFDLLPQAIIAYATVWQIKLIFLRRKREPGSLLHSFISQITSDFFRLYHVRSYPILSKTRRVGKLIISASDYHLLNLKDLIFQAAKKWSIIILGKSTPQLRKQLSDKVSFSDIYQFISISKYFSIIFSQIQRLITSPFDRFPRFVLQKLNPIETVLCRLCQPVWSYWKTILVPQGNLHLYTFNKLIQCLSPKVVIASNGIDNYNRPLLLAAQVNDVKNVVVIHQHITDKIDIVEENAGVESALLIPSQRLSKLFGTFPGKTKIIVTGSPILDRYYHFSNLKTAAFHSPLKLLFLLCQEHLRFQEQNEAIIWETLLELEKFPQSISVTLRNHPQHPPLLPHFHRQFPFPIIERNKTALHEELLAHDIVITQITSAAIEAIVLRKPLIYLNTHSVKNIRPFATSGAALGVYAVESLLQAIYSLLNDPHQLRKRQDAFVAQYCGDIDGKSSARVLAVIEEFVARENESKKGMTNNQESKD